MAFSGRRSDAQWARIAPHLPRCKGTSRGGRPPADPRTCFEGMWILWAGAPWSALPPKYSSSTTCWRRLRQWDEDGTLLALWRALLADLNDAEKVRWDECLGDGSFAPAKGGRQSRQDQEGQGHKSGCFWSSVHGMAVLQLTHLADFEADFAAAHRLLLENTARSWQRANWTKAPGPPAHGAGTTPPAPKPGAAPDRRTATGRRGPALRAARERGHNKGGQRR